MQIGIVGLGIVGLSAAVRLAELGHSVTGFEQFALLHDQGSSHGDTRIFRRYPFEGEVYVDLAAQSYNGWQRWNSESGQGLFVESGGFHAAPADSKYVKNVVQFEQERGLVPEVISAADCNKRWPIFNIPDDFAVVVEKNNGFMQPDATRQFLADKATNLGADLRFNTQVQAVEAEQATVVTATGQQKFDALIVTAGPWLPQLVPALAPHLKVERRVLAWYRPEIAIDPAQTPTFRIGTEFYGMPTPDGSIKVGMNEHYHEIVDPAAVRDPDLHDEKLIATNAQQYLAHMPAKPYKLARCLYTLTQDEDFIVDRAPGSDSTFFMSCCSGHGFKYAPAYGDQAAKLIEGREDPAFKIFSLNRFNA